MNIIDLIQEIISHVWRPNSDGTYTRLSDEEKSTGFKKLPNTGITKLIRSITQSTGNQAHRATYGDGSPVLMRSSSGYTQSRPTFKN